MLFRSRVRRRLEGRNSQGGHQGPDAPRGFVRVDQVDWRAGTLTGGTLAVNGAFTVSSGGVHALDATVTASSASVGSGETLTLTGNGALAVGTLRVAGTLTAPGGISTTGNLDVHNELRLTSRTNEYEQN